MKLGDISSKLKFEYGVEVYSYSSLPDILPNGFWVLNENFIVPCHDSKGAHYGIGLIILSLAEIKKYQIKLNFILNQYKNIENFAKDILSKDSKIKENSLLSYEAVYLAMYSSPINAVRVNKTTGITKGIDIRTPFNTNKKNINLSKDIALFYKLDYNYATHIT
jgi:hypothetical protein